MVCYYQNEYVHVPTLSYSVNTHVHADHVTGTGLIKQQIKSCKSAIAAVSGAKADVFLKPGDKVKFGSFELEARSTPGHTDGEMCSFRWDNFSSMQKTCHFLSFYRECSFCTCKLGRYSLVHVEPAHCSSQLYTHDREVHVYSFPYAHYLQFILCHEPTIIHSLGHTNFFSWFTTRPIFKIGKMEKK